MTSMRVHFHVLRSFYSTAKIWKMSFPWNPDIFPDISFYFLHIYVYAWDKSCKRDAIFKHFFHGQIIL